MFSRRQFLVASSSMLAAGCSPPADVVPPSMPERPKAPEPPFEFTASSGVNPFGLELYSQLRTLPGNVFLSPYSIHTALAMTEMGARGRTGEQMRTVLHLDGATMSPPQRVKDVTFEVANALWAQTGTAWSEAFRKPVIEEFHAELNDADFRSKPEEERQRINAWVVGKTREKILGLLPRGSITDLTRMVLVNAIYFKGDWLVAFKKADTQPSPFSRLDGTKIDVPLMHRHGTMSYHKTDDTLMVSLPYKGGDIGFYAFMPKNGESFDKWDAGLTLKAIDDGCKALRQSSCEVQLWLPRFKVETTYSLPEPLQRLGMVDAFGNADFSGMTTDGTELVISDVIHKAFVDVNEEGTEAAAATAVVMADTVSLRIPQPPKVFRADRPFVFALRHEASGTLLFLGRYTGPS